MPYAFVNRTSVSPQEIKKEQLQILKTLVYLIKTTQETIFVDKTFRHYTKSLSNFVAQINHLNTAVEAIKKLLNKQISYRKNIRTIL